jgi:uncharacterized GH25 family protein
MQLKTRIAACLAVLCGTIGAAQAHNLWLLPSSTVLSKSEWVTVDAAVSNDLFFFNHVPLNIERLAVTAPDGSAVALENVHRGKLRSVFDLNLARLGTYQIALVNSGLNASYKDASGQARRWRGTPEKFAAEVPPNAQDLKVTQSQGRVETFITVGKPSAVKATGQGLELVPVTHPNDLVKGEQATFAFHIDGRPAQGVEVVLLAGGTRYRDAKDEIKAVTDAQGRFSVTFPSAGMYWMEAEAQDGKTSMPQAKVRRLSYAGTFEVLP